MSNIYRLKRDDPDFGLSNGDMLLTIPYWLDPDKVTVICRITDGYDPECNQYKHAVARVSDEELADWNYERSKAALADEETTDE